MRLYFWLMLIVCLGYYLVILLYTKRMNSTFSGFWLIAGTVHGLLGAIWCILPDAVQVIVMSVIIILWFMFLIIEVQIIRAMHEKTSWIPEYLIILGAQVRGTYITNSLRRRLDRAYQFWKKHSEIKIIVSGGQGRGEDITEAAAMSSYLKDLGVDTEKIFEEDRSTSTRENLIFSKRLIGGEERRIGVVTNDFHIFRSILLAKECGFCCVCGIPAGTNRVLFINYMVREFFAILWMRLRSFVCQSLFTCIKIF